MLQILWFPKALPLVVLRGTGEIEIPRRVFATFVPTKVGKDFKKEIFLIITYILPSFKALKIAKKSVFMSNIYIVVRKIL